jgi:hypothetical protein
MTTKLNVLVLESERGAADVAISELTAAGHRVLRCHEPGAPAFPCNGLADEDACPLRTSTVDVALTVRSRPRSQPAPQEDGVACAIEHHVPLVVAGPVVLNPYDGFATEVLDRTFDVADACERAAVAPLRRHGERAATALAAVFETHDIDAVTDVTVVRDHGRLTVHVTGAPDLDHAVKGVASVRIIGALRAYDRDAAGIDVQFS